MSLQTALSAVAADQIEKKQGKHRPPAKGKAKPNAKAPLGQGGRFAAMEKKVAAEPGVRDPAALSAAIGRKKYGASKMASLAAKGR